MITVNHHTLPNGLKIVHHEDKSTQMIALNLLYDVGARDEHPDHTGFAHLFEHLMFGGSINIADYDDYVQEAGGESNAWTSNDITNFYVTLPYRNAETAFWLESDRMLSLEFSTDSLEVQRQVVIEEFKQRNLNQPYGDIAHLMRALAFKQHPYQWPTIGKEISHIAKATMDEVKDFFYRFYAPNNAILAVTGHISFEETIRLAEKWFGPIPSRNVQPRQLAQEAEQTAERRMSVEREVPLDALYMAFHMCDRLHPDYYAYDMITDILSNGKSSRFIQTLIEQRKIFTSVDAYIDGSVDAGLLHINGKPSEGHTLEECEKAIWEELEKMKTSQVTDLELEKVKNKYESEQIFSNINYLNVATNLAYYELMGGAERINTEVDRYRAVTKAQIQAVSVQCFRQENCCVIHYNKKK